VTFLFCLARTLVDVLSRVLQAEAGAVSPSTALASRHGAARRRVW